MTFNDARYTALAIRRRLDDIGAMVRRDPSLVRMAQDSGTGDRIYFWYSNGQEIRYNVSEAKKELDVLISKYGLNILKTRSGQMMDFRIELPV